LILFGANDSCLPTSATGQHVSLENYRENLKQIITEPALIAHKPKILLVTPPPIHETHLESEDVQKGRGILSRHQNFTAQYADVVRDLAAELKDHNVVLVDLHKAMIDEAIRLTPDFVAGPGLIGSKDAGDSSGLRKLLVDGLHFTGAGYKIFFDIVVPHIGKHWAEESPTDPSWPFP
jgi:lysophospholipase L1-like esterase